MKKGGSRYLRGKRGRNNTRKKNCIRTGGSRLRNVVRNKSTRKKHRGGGVQDIWGSGTSSIMQSLKGGEPKSYTRLPVDIRRDPYLV